MAQTLKSDFAMRKYLKYIILAIIAFTIAGEVKRAIGETAFVCLFGGAFWAIFLWEAWLKDKFK